ncbi:shikimate dehydrogenase [Kozakia baliensis]|uniref:shikimate dehydrogenase n=1 Tax=Kozakia baliensis TaxID=153496 RepID=UPI00087D47AF|nr:shikimate dehydrogenase [Kozakia baliensis]AOX19423.1 shikimate dehydrogenase [Kozakia baliensis]
MSASEQKQFVGVVGWPVAHSRSPILHNHWCEKYGINGEYVALPVPPGELEACLKELAEVGLRGVNITIPHKEEAYRLVTQRSETAIRAGAVNTICFLEDGTTTGDCTDGSGFVANLQAHGVEVAGRVLMLGAGGASRAVVAALLDVGCEVLIANRTRARAEALVEALGGGEVVEWAEWPQILPSCRLLVNGTSLGMKGQPEFDWDAVLAEAPAGLVVTDMVYAPLETPLLAAAKRRNLQTIDGLGMLMYQARAGFAAWFGVTPEVDEETRELLVRSLS